MKEKEDITNIGKIKMLNKYTYQKDKSRIQSHNSTGFKCDIKAFNDFLHQDKSAYQTKLSLSSDMLLLELIEIYIKNCNKNKNSKAFNDIKNKIFNFEKEYSVKLQIKDINSKFWNMFTGYLTEYTKTTSISKPDEKLSPSSIHAMCRKLIQVLDYAKSNGMNNLHPEYANCISSPKRIVDNTLSMDELSQLYHFNFDEMSTFVKIRSVKIDNFKKARDMFILSCCLGISFNTIFNMSEKSFNTQKTVLNTMTEFGIISINMNKFSLYPSISNEILKRYDYKCPFQSIYAFNTQFRDMIKYIDLAYRKLTEIYGKYINKSISIPPYDIIKPYTYKNTFIKHNTDRGFTKMQLINIVGNYD